MSYIVYILISTKDPNRYYIGISQNLNRRLKKHNSGECNSYSKKYAPWKVETYITFKNKLLAQKFESYLKHGSGHAFLKKRLI